MIIAGEDFSEFGLKDNIIEVMEPDALIARLLMYYPWETDTKVSIWTNPPEEVIPMYTFSIQLF